MARAKRYKADTRDPGGFVAIPWMVLDSSAFQDLSHHGKALLLEVARQFHGDDNGRMLLSRAYLKTRGWLSAGKIQEAKTELLEAGLVFETVLGQRPNKASWYAVTWKPLDKLDGFDLGAAAAFERRAYQKVAPKPKRPPPMAPAAARQKNAVLVPAAGTGDSAIAPAAGTEKPAAVPVSGTIRPVLGPPSVPVAGHPLEMPSPASTHRRGNKGSKGAPVAVGRCRVG